MNNNSNTSLLNQSSFLEAVILASNRSRNVILILSTASILAFVGVMNSRPNNWFVSRIVFISNNLEYLKGRQMIGEKEEEMKQLEAECRNKQSLVIEPAPTPPSNRQNNRNAQNLPPANPIINSNTNSNSRNDPCEKLHTLGTDVKKEKEKYNGDRFNNSRKHFSNMEKEYGLFESPKSVILNNEIEKAESDLLMLSRNRRESLTVFRVPFFGTSFDINDLVIVSGATFIIILIWLRLSLWTELNSTHQVFERVSENELIDCYEYLSMHLVFTIPKTLDSDLKKFAEKQWKWLALLLIALPFIIQSLVLVNDLATLDSGMRISMQNTMVGFVLGFASLIPIGLLTISCFSLTLTLNKLWRSQGSKIDELKRKTNLGEDTVTNNSN